MLPCHGVGACVSLRSQELCWQGLKLLADSTKMDRSGGETRQKTTPALQVGGGHGVNYPTLPRTFVTEARNCGVMPHWGQRIQMSERNVRLT